MERRGERESTEMWSENKCVLFLRLFRKLQMVLEEGEEGGRAKAGELQSDDDDDTTKSDAATKHRRTDVVY